MFLLLGLGNPGEKYCRTPHNLGFEMLDTLDGPEGWREWGRSLVKRVQIAGHETLLAKPLTYMNLSGEAARELLDFYKLGPADLAVALDDVNLPWGAIRIRTDGSDGGHNGLRSLIAHCGGNFARIRLGAGPPPPGRDLAAYVLSRYPPTAAAAVAEIRDQFPQIIDFAFKNDWSRAAGRYNRRHGDDFLENGLK